MLYSRYTHKFDLCDAVAFYNSLRMKPVYLTKTKYEAVEAFIHKNTNSIPQELKSEVNELRKQKILVENSAIDEKIINFVRSGNPIPHISVCYFILTEQCNLACKYCFLGNNDSVRRCNFKKGAMSISTAEKSLQFFLKELKKHPDQENLEPAIIFYGGEPLINFETLEYVASRINELKKTEKCLEKTHMNVVTNGTLLTKERLLKMRDLGVGIGISIDGCDEKSNEMRVDTSGKPIFSKIITALDTAKENDMDISFSVTLTEESLKSKDGILDLIKKYNIKGFGFNILMNSDGLGLRPDYYKRASKFIIDCFVELRKFGIYEDRVMRKVKAFQKAQIYYSDCAAQSGGQIVFVPDGSIGVCHGCLAERKYFISNVDDKNFDASKNETLKEWASLSPVNKEECQDCEALGICGGGCPIDAINKNGEKDIHGIDRRFCVHAKMTLEFLIRDLYRIIKENAISKEGINE